MTNTTRRKFLRDTSLTATGVCLASQLGATKNEFRAKTIKCAPGKTFTLLGTLSSTQSGKWSDPATWGGRVPASGDTPLISSGHTVVFDVKDTTVAGVSVSANSVLQFDAANTVTLNSTKNVVVLGKLQMTPSSASVIQTIRFTGVNESSFVGGGMDVLDSDIGLWVMGSGQADLIGSTKTSWLRASGSISAGATSISLEAAPTGWAAGDEITIAPTESPTVGAAYATGFDDRIIQTVSGSTITLNAGTVRPHPMVNGKWTAEVINLTRNVRIEGTAAGRAHIYVRSAMPQNIKYIGIRYMGARKDTNGDGVTELVSGRYGLHFHHCYDGSRGSLIQGCVVRDTNNHSYVPHQSHGMTFKDNVAYNVLETAFWWDPSEATHDVLFDHNIVARCNFLPRSLNMNAEFAPTFSSSGFALNTGDSDVCNNNVVVGGSMGDFAEGGAYNWEATLIEGIWGFSGNMAHNNACGLRVWQNTTRNHVIEDFIAYHNGLAIFHGAYANSYTYNGITLYGNGIQLKAASGNSNCVRFQNAVIDGAGIIDNGIEIIHSPLPGERPLHIRNVTISNCKANAILDTNAPEVHSADIILCNITGPITLASGTAPGETLRVQPAGGTPYQITASGKSDIAKFAPTLWGTGKGLKGEYFNSNNFTNPALTRIDSNVSFSEWSTGVHYRITGETYSVRWTGKIQPQYSETYTFMLGSGGGHRLWIDNKLILDGWTEHYPGSFTSQPIALVAGQLYDIKLEFFNTSGGTGIGLFWQSPSLPREYVPQSQLYADAVVTPTNQPPVANAGADITITLPISNTTLNGSNSTDPDGTISTYRWTQVSGPSTATIASNASATTGVSSLIAGTYVFRLTVTDDKGATSSDDVTVSVNGTNQAPVANAGTDISITLPTNSTTLNGSASKDPDGIIKTYSWTKISGPSQYTIADATAVSTALTNLVAGTYIFRLQVTDDKGATATDDITVVVNNTGTPANQPPVASAGADMNITLPTSSVTLNGSASKDPDGTIQRYSWTKISGPTQFLFASAGSPITVVSNLIAGTYVFRLTVTDDKGASATDDVTVIVNQANSTNNLPPIADAGADITIQVGTTSVRLDGSASKDPDGTIAAYRWTKISGPSAFNLSTWDTATTSLSQVVAGVYVFRLTVTDDKGATGTDTVTVTVLDLKAATTGTLSAVASPNPSTSVFRLQITSSNNTEFVTIRVYDSGGNTVTRINNVSNNTTVTVGAYWRPGLYTAVITQGGQQVVIKLLKQ
jgi:hypothetical protein